MSSSTKLQKNQWNQEKTLSTDARQRSKDTWQSNTGYLAIYPWIHCKVSLDIFLGQFFASLFLLSPDAFSYYKLNLLTVLQKPYWIGWHMQGNCSAFDDAPAFFWRIRDFRSPGICGNEWTCNHQGVGITSWNGRDCIFGPTQAWYMEWMGNSQIVMTTALSWFILSVVVRGSMTCGRMRRANWWLAS